MNKESGTIKLFADLDARKEGHALALFLIPNSFLIPNFFSWLSPHHLELF